ncbi:MAG: hypothetical protein ACR2HN_10280 [Tepidiformaceae bacterium]
MLSIFGGWRKLVRRAQRGWGGRGQQWVQPSNAVTRAIERELRAPGAGRQVLIAPPAAPALAAPTPPAAAVIEGELLGSESLPLGAEVGAEAAAQAVAAATESGRQGRAA